MNHFGLSIDPDTNDLHLAANGDLAIVQGSDAVAQHIRQRLMTFAGEWFLDTTAGMTWLAEIMGREYDPALAEAIVKAEILRTHGVTEITSFSVGFSSEVRALEIKDVQVVTAYGEEVQV